MAERNQSRRPMRNARRPPPHRSCWLFASVYFFWGSTYTAIRIGAADMPALLLSGTRFLIAGAILLAGALAQIAPRVSSQDHADAGADRVAVAGLRQCGPGICRRRPCPVTCLSGVGGDSAVCGVDRDGASRGASRCLPALAWVCCLALPPGSAALALAAQRPGRQTRRCSGPSPRCSPERFPGPWQHRIQAARSGSTRCGCLRGEADCGGLLYCTWHGPRSMAAISSHRERRRVARLSITEARCWVTPGYIYPSSMCPWVKLRRIPM